ncbi:sugar transporter [Magnaporthiopsis poae ATCC 64411]|uniref:Sugar transporter n=1 Tax=Magnaporthiopsis poae (strain ATCC 64411 / 73-15) TaxID=644358 RepID=A0A0C4DNW0_MAGP6|nr:sugar transporter [Magnaporthiopsis poae ATCC 64411]
MAGASLEKPMTEHGDAGSGRSEAAHDYPPWHGMSTSRYLATRVSSLKPPMIKAPNPIRLLLMLDRHCWAFFLVAFVAWTWDAFDFFTVSLTVPQLAKAFGRTNTDITWGITLVLMFRSVGSVIFGIAADRYGRKWPFIVNNILFIVLELGTGFCNTYGEFLACRALFGVAMGGLYGNAAATALEDLPEEARGLMSGILQQGYAFGYLLATAFARALVDTTPHGWRPLFCALMAGFNFMSHGSQDLYPTMLTSQFGFSADDVTVTQIVANLGAMLGGTVVGYCSQIVGRRLSILVCCVVGGALLYPYTFVSTRSLVAAAFFQQFCVQGAWGVIPIHLMELSPGAFRTFVVGTSYQLGNLASSASSTIESTIGERFPLPDRSGSGARRYEYGKVICIFMGCVYAYVIVLTLLGPEYLRRNFDVEHDEDAREAVGEQAVAETARRSGRVGGGQTAGSKSAV